MTIVTIDLAGASRVAGIWARLSAVGMLDRLLAGRARENAAEAVEDAHRRRRQRHFEESEMLLVCPAAAREPAAVP